MNKVMRLMMVMVLVNGAAMGQNDSIKYTDSIIKRNRSMFMYGIVMPSFPGGDDSLIKYLKENLIYPAKAKEARIQGKVFVTFIVNVDGKISDVKVLRGFDASIGGCDFEAIRVVQSMPPWKPAINDKGKIFPVQFNLPIQFKL